MTSPSITQRGTMMSSLEGCKGLERFTTSGPYRAIVASFKYLLTSGIFVSLRGSGIVSGGHESFSNLGTLKLIEL